MGYIRSILAAFLVLALVGCSSPSFFRASSFSSNIQDVNVTSIVISKKNRRMYLFDGKTVLRSYKIGLGSEPVGDKKVQGDGKTPEGLYYIDRKNPKSRYYLSLGISYPNSADKAEAQALGKSPGGDIFIHGEDTKPHFFKRDWTAGCIAVKNREIREIYALVKVGTPILIHP
jgi:murein L,D-transpeptidase YafK